MKCVIVAAMLDQIKKYLIKNEHNLTPWRTKLLQHPPDIALLTLAGALPHAHQPGAAGVCVPGVGHAAGDPLHGCARV